MQLNIGSGKFRPYIKYNSKAGRWYTGTPDGDVELVSPEFVIDLDNIATGWLSFKEGRGPIRVIDPALDYPAPSPGDGFKRGFLVLLYIKGQGVAELSSASGHVGNAIKQLYAEFQKGREDSSKVGKLPVVVCKNSTPMKDKYGTNYRPNLEIKDWVARNPSHLPSEAPYSQDEVWTPSTKTTKIPNFDMDDEPELPFAR